MRVILKLLLAGAILLVLLAGVGLWRLSRGPITIDFLTPRIEAAVRAADPSLQLDIGTTALVWDREHGHLDLRANQVRLGSGEQTIAIPAVAFRLRVEALLRAEVELESVYLIEPSLRLVRESDGSIALGVGGPGGSGFEGGWLGGALSQSGAPGGLEKIGVRDGDLWVDDRAGGQTWKLDRFDLHLDLGEAGIEARADGDLDLAPLYASGDGTAPSGAAASARIELEVSLPKGGDRVELRRLSAGVDELELRGSGSVEALRGGRPSLTVSVALPRLATDRLGRYWPPSTAAEARDWVTRNIGGGTVTNGAATVRAKVDEQGRLVVTGLDGGLEYEGLRVAFLKTMPPVTGIKGNATFSLGGAEFSVREAKLLDIAVSQATVRFPPGNPPRIAIDAAVRGPVDTVVTVLDNPPVELTKAIGVRPRDGSLSGRVGMAFPLRDGLAYADLGLTASADLRGVSVDRVPGDLSVTGGDFTLALRTAAVDVSGRARLQGMPLLLTLRDTIGAKGKTRIEVKGEVDADGWRQFGVDPGDMLRGPSAVSATVSPDGAGGVILEGSADLVRATIDLPGGTLNKAAGVPGKASARLRFAGDQLAAVERFDLTFAGNALDASATRAAMRGQAKYGWSGLHARATFAGRPGAVPGQATLDVTPAGTFTFASSDVGTLLGATGFTEGRGGKALLHGTIGLNQNGVPFDGRLLISDFVLQRAPILAKVLTLASVRGLVSAMTREGIRYDRITAELSHRGGVLRIADGVARSSSLALMANGALGLANDTIDLEGRVIPSYFGINEGVARVPLIGRMLTGNDAKALQAIDFTAKGSLEAPDVKVNALASLAPQALQDLLRRFDW